MKEKHKQPSRAYALLAGAGTSSQYDKRETIYCQGATSRAMFYVQSGMVMLTVHTKGRRPSVIAVLPAGNFFNESSLSKRAVYLSTATTVTPSSILTIKTGEMLRLLHDEVSVSTLFRVHMLAANVRFRENLLDMLVNSARQRLARALLRLANIGSRGSPRNAKIPRISQLALAEIVGTTRSRVNYFMNQFRKSGYISYNGIISVHSTLRQALLNKQTLPPKRDAAAVAE